MPDGEERASLRFPDFSGVSFASVVREIIRETQKNMEIHGSGCSLVIERQSMHEFENRMTRYKLSSK